VRNVTITLDQEVARWVRVQAAKADTSVSRWIGERMREQMQQAEAYQEAMDLFFSIRPRQLRDDDAAYPTREEPHDRQDLR
jgi:hypothetical protein